MAQLAERWPYVTESYSQTYVRAVLAALDGPGRITDVGAGRRTIFAAQLPAGCELVGVDVLSDDLAANTDLDVRVERDVVADGLPAEALGSGVVCSHFVLEHLPDVDVLAREAHRVLRPGGTTVHVFAGRRSVFATLNRLLPDVVTSALLFRLRPEAVDIGGFKTHYDRTNPRAVRRVFERAGFEAVRVDVSWETSPYFRWFAPAFVLARLWENGLRRSRRHDLASYVVLVARKPEAAR